MKGRSLAERSHAINPVVPKGENSGLNPLSPQGVLEAADGVLNLSLGFVGPAVCFQLGISCCSARGLLNFALSLLCRSLHTILVHDFSPRLQGSKLPELRGGSLPGMSSGGGLCCLSNERPQIYENKKYPREYAPNETQEALRAPRRSLII